MKVLYVCPYAHYSGHQPHAATVEPATLSRNGVDVTLLTFCGITNNPKLPVRHIIVTHDNSVLKLLRKHTITRWFLMPLEMALTLNKAARMREYDILHLRDGEPFLFMASLLSLFHKGLRWTVSLTASVLVVPKTKTISFRGLYTFVMNVVINNSLWRFVYAASMKRNQFVFTPQNELTRQGYEEYMNGVFKGHLVCVPWGISKDGARPLTKIEARTRLGLLIDKFILLSFGATHPGKDLRIIMKALKQLPENTMLMHAGTWSFSLSGNMQELAKEYGVEDKVRTFNYYVPEEEKPLFFYAADAAILSYTKQFVSTSSMVFEAAKFNLPVISSDANTLGRDVAAYNLGLLFEAENAESLVDAIESFREANVEMFKRNCGAFLNDFSETKWAKRYKDVYTGLMK